MKKLIAALLAAGGTLLGGAAVASPSHVHWVELDHNDLGQTVYASSKIDYSRGANAPRFWTRIDMPDAGRSDLIVEADCRTRIIRSVLMRSYETDGTERPAYEFRTNTIGPKDVQGNFRSLVLKYACKSWRLHYEK